jgi:alpha-beta hydrolase superfamily lysophospholipase
MPRETTFLSHDGLALWARHWPSTGVTRRGSVAIVHGVAEHSGRYQHLADHLTRAGFDIHAFDLRGHGRSEGRRVHVDRWNDYLLDMDHFLAHLRDHLSDDHSDDLSLAVPKTPVVLYGHSLGALIVLDYLIQRNIAPGDSESGPDPSHLAAQATPHSPEIEPSEKPLRSPQSAKSPIAGESGRPAENTRSLLRGAIVSGVPLRPVAAARPHLILAARMLSRILPHFRLPLNVDPEGLSRDPEVVEAYRSDPLVETKGTTRWGMEALQAWKRVEARAGEITCPLLILHGEGDRISTAEGSRQLFADVNSRDKRLRIYTEGAHEPHNDLGSAEVLADVQVWLEGDGGLGE